MPSSHSQFLWFVSLYMVLFILGLAIIMAYSRVYLQYHTVSQVVWGGVVGSLGAVQWFILTQLVFTPRLYPWVASLSIAEFFLIRDTSSVPNILWFEYVTVRGEINTRKKACARKNQ